MSLSSPFRRVPNVNLVSLIVELERWVVVGISLEYRYTTKDDAILGVVAGVSVRVRDISNHTARLDL
jgi:hypothetical protein